MTLAIGYLTGWQTPNRAKLYAKTVPRVTKLIGKKFSTNNAKGFSFANNVPTFFCKDYANCLYGYIVPLAIPALPLRQTLREA